MMKINDTWNEMESDNSSIGLLLRRCPVSVMPDAFIGFRTYEKQRCIALKIKSAALPDLSRYSNLKDIKPELIPDDMDKSKAYLLILLKDTQHEDVFATLCEDLINGISDIQDEDKVVKELLNRLEKWKSLFDKASAEGLDAEEQRGLYGELYFLRTWLNGSADCSKCIHAWVGTEKAIRDFQYAGWALEVKTTHGNNHQKIQINSERQLDTANLDHLLLLHISLEVQQHNGETLNDIIDSLMKSLGVDIASQTRFRSKLFQAGYFRHHTALYENTGYQIRQQNYYLVNNTFPRIEESDIRKGVGDVTYSIILSDYSDYSITENSLLETIN